MTANEIDPEAEKYQLEPLRKEINELTAKREILDRSLNRLAGEAFNNGPLAVQNIDRIVSKRGAQAACDTIDSKGLRERVSIGIRRGSWLNPGSIDLANAAMVELKTAIRERAETDKKITDHIEAYKRLERQARGSGSPADTNFDTPGQPQDPTDTRPWWRNKVKPDDDDQSAGQQRERRWERDR
jgi:hypothetical protein